MPAKSSWLLRIPHIIEQLQALPAPVVDRRICERLFNVRRRRAIDLMQHFGGYRSGNTVLVDRLAFIHRLTEMTQTAEYTGEDKRKQRLAVQLDELNRCKAAAQIRLTVSARAQETMLSDLPSGMVFAPGRLLVTFSTPEDLFAKLYELAQAAANNFDRVCDALS